MKVLLANHGKKVLTVRHGDRIAPLVVTPVTRVEVIEVATID